MKGDLSVLGIQSELPVRIAAAATRWNVGEPIHNLSSWTSGAASVNTSVVAAADTPVLGTHSLMGVSIQIARPFVTIAGSPAITAQTTLVARPISNQGRIRGRAKTVANINTESALLGFILDLTLISYNATGAPGSNPLYTIIETVTANTSGLQIVEGNVAKGTLDVIVDPRAYRNTVS